MCFILRIHKPCRLQQKSNIEKILSFSTYRKGLTFLSLIRFTSGRHAAKLSLLYALSACWRSLATHIPTLDPRAYQLARVFWLWQNVFILIVIFFYQVWHLRFFSLNHPISSHIKTKYVCNTFMIYLNWFTIF